MVSDLDFRDAWLAEIASLMAQAPQYPPGGTPARPAPTPPPQPHFVKFGDSMVCTVCRLDSRYCKGHAPPSPPPTTGDGDGSDLSKRIRAARSGR